ncbi:hypothetical protein FRC02_005889 [Tulasnella sp. 418]|nr:hypothetical protein FRC02_005889 [Tulasnella sp. 418]
MDNYDPGDKICLFGFSRGAYTARALAAMLYKVGLLPRFNEEHIPFAWKIFKDSKFEHKFPADDVRRWHSLNFRRTFSREVEVDFIGIWDTVSSVGLFPRTLSCTDDNPIVRNVVHAVSLDEVRIKFRTNLWHPTNHENDTPESQTITVPGAIAADYAALARGNSQFGNRTDTGRMSLTSLEEVWFAGDHCDVGGGNTTYKEVFALSHIPLRWMVRQAMKRTSIIFDRRVLEIYGIRLEPSSTGHASIHSVYGEGNLSLEDYRERERRDALSTEHSAFTGNKRLFWSILEVIPLLRSIEVFGKRIWVFL